MNKKTKIVATIGPASESVEIIEKMILEGVNVFRFNLKHNDFEWHKTTVDRVRNVSQKIKTKVGIMIDLQGPEIRLETKDQLPIELKEGDIFWLHNRLESNQKVIKIIPGEAIKSLKKGDVFFIDDGSVEAVVVGIDKEGIRAETRGESVIKNKKSLNIISEDLDLPILNDKDKNILSRLDEINPDYIALSFVRTERDVVILKKLLERINSKAKVIAKIENSKAIRNIEGIIKESDGIMIARGDLGVEVPIRELAFWQKKIIDLCREYSKPVIVATQMLQSMVKNDRPTRAEATDVSNAVFDGADALMLSEETSIGINPVRVIKEMSSIAIFSEESSVCNSLVIEPQNSTEVLVDAAVKIIENNKELKIKAVIIFTQSGRTARILSRYRISLPIIAVTDSKETTKSLILSYGMKSYFRKFGKTSFKMPKFLINKWIENGLVTKGDTLLVIHGNNWMESGSTSDISLVTV